MMDFSNINLLENIDNTNIELTVNKYIENVNSSLYQKYLTDISNFFKETTTNNKLKFNYGVDENGNYNKIALEKKNEKENKLIKKPIYINIKNTLEKLENDINNEEIKLRYYRTLLINDDESIKTKFNEIQQHYDSLIKDKEIINAYITKVNNIEFNNNKINELKKINIQKNIEQYELIKTIQLNKKTDHSSLENNYKLYISNNNLILKNISEINRLKKITHGNFIIKEVFDNKSSKPIKKKRKGGKKSKEIQVDNTQTGQGLDDISLINLIQKDKQPLKEDSKELDIMSFDNLPKEKAASPCNQLEEISFDELIESVPKEKSSPSNQLDEISFDELIESVPKEKSASPSNQLKEISFDELIESVPEISNPSCNELDQGLKKISLDIEPNKDMNIEVLDLGDDLESLQLFEDNDSGNDNEICVFNKSELSKDLLEEDKNIKLNLENTDDFNFDNSLKEKEKDNCDEIDFNKILKKEEEKKKVDIDINNLSKELNKKVSDPNIKHIFVDPNLQFSNIPNSKKSKGKK